MNHPKRKTVIVIDDTLCPEELKDIIHEYQYSAGIEIHRGYLEVSIQESPSLVSKPKD